MTLPPEIVGDAKNYLVENAQVTVTFVEDKAVTIELPSSVVLKVADAPEGIRGDSANNVQKAIVLETGITVQAPLFIKTGEKIKVDTRTGQVHGAGVSGIRVSKSEAAARHRGSCSQSSPVQRGSKPNFGPAPARYSAI